MLHPRIIPCLLLSSEGLVKTERFGKRRYIGDPINAVRIFNEKMVDELIVLDIDATAEGREPNFRTIEHLAAECRMPLCYGGGIKSLETAKKLIGLGVEKVAISSAVVEKPGLITSISEEIGCQSLVVVIDVKKKRFSDKNYEIFIHNGKVNTRKCPFTFVQEVERLGIGEIVINSIDHDGEMNGYDWQLIQKIRDVTHVPLTALGGAGSLDDISKLIAKFGIIGAAAGSLFVYKGVYRAVLINYPTKEQKTQILQRSNLLTPKGEHNRAATLI